MAYDFENGNIPHEHDSIMPFIRAHATQSGTRQIDGFASVDDLPQYDEQISNKKFFSRTVVKHCDFS